MNFDENNSEKELTVKNKVVLVLAVLSFAILIILVIMDYTPPVYKEFSSDNFYVGVYGDDVDPRSTYRKMTYSDVTGSSGCRNELTRSDSATVCGRFMWIGESLEIKSAADIDSMAVNGDTTRIQPYVDGANIVAPARIAFVNSNINQESRDSIYMAVSINNKYILRWDNIKTWWCHIGKENPNKHTQVIGAGGEAAVVSAGYIVGQANSDTVVSLYKINDDGSTTPVPVSELFF